SPWYVVEKRSGVPRTSSVVMTTSAPSSRRILPSCILPVRILGPWRSRSTATGLPTFSEASRTQRRRLSWSAWTPWEKLSLATSIPARTSASIRSGLSVDGPRVQTSLALLMDDDPLAGGRTSTSVVLVFLFLFLVVVEGFVVVLVVLLLVGGLFVVGGGEVVGLDRQGEVEAATQVGDTGEEVVERVGEFLGHGRRR